MASVKEVFQRVVKSRINGNKEHGWGSDDSLAVICELIADNAGGTVEDSVDAELQAAIKEVVNPSQFRQKLESASILNKQETKKAKVKSLLEGFGS